jgi:hypothetical protein
MIKGGFGGSKTQTGLRFEERIHLATALSKLPDFEVKGDEVYKNGNKVAHLYSKNKLYANLLAEKG